MIKEMLEISMVHPRAFVLWMATVFISMSHEADFGMVELCSIT